MMNNNEVRLFSTLIVWTAITVIAISLMIFNVELEGFMAVFIPILLILAGLSSMRYIWRDSGQDSRSESIEKAKRKSRIEHLVATLNEDELAELHSRLVAGYDGEAVPLDDLLAEYERGGRRSG
ncbi:MAG: hypothetical protein H6671_11730 [Anaerolineaceae bacterium]|nr:hypothetical protein [Anaerolineaceae bacterium]